MSIDEVSSQADAAWLSVEGLKHSFGRQTVFRGLNLTIARGEIVSLLGPSGVGKSTLIKMLLGLIVPDSGKVRLAGRDILELPIAERNIGVVYQNYSLFEHMNVRANVAFPLKAREARNPLRALASLIGVETNRDLLRRVDEALSLVRMTAHRTKRPRQLSGGEQQRVALARALVLHPDLLCLDEPLAALDQELRAAVLGEIRRLHEERGTTALYVTHNVSEAFSIGDRVGVLNDGVIEQIGSPRSIYDRPRSEFVGQITGELNVLQVEGVTPEGTSLVCRLQGGATVRLPATGAPKPTKIGMRPEKLRVGDAGDQTDVGFRANLVRTTFLGPMTRLELRLDRNGPPVAALISSTAPVPADANGLLILNYAPEDWLIFP